MSESTIQANIRIVLGNVTKHTRLFRNNVGVALHNDGSRVVYGLAPDSSDLIGYTSVIVTPDMVGTRIALFTAAEVKTASGRLKPGQDNFLKVIQNAGGIAGVVRSPDEAIALIKSAPGKAT